MAAAALLQLATWAAMYGEGFIGQVRQGHFGPNRLHVLEVLFSARHGLFSWHPLYLLGALGWVVGWRRERHLSLYCLLGLVCSAGVNSLMSDWWGSDAFEESLRARGLERSPAWSGRLQEVARQAVNALER